MEYIEKEYGSRFVSRDSDTITIEVQGRQEIYKILKIYEFTSARKMMSVTVEGPDGRVWNFAKGADAVIKKKVKRMGQREIGAVQELDRLAAEGLRTLMFAYREIKLNLSISEVGALE